MWFCLVMASHFESWQFSMTPGANLTLNPNPEDDIEACQNSEHRKVASPDAFAPLHPLAPPHTFASPHAFAPLHAIAPPCTYASP
jgi:hypothetical protein